MAKNYLVHFQKVFALIAVILSVLIVRDLYFRAGSSFYVTGAERENSLEMAEQAIYLDPFSSEAYFARANIFEKNEETKRSIADFEQSLRLGPFDYFTWIKLGLARQKNTDPAGAERAFRESIRLAPAYGLPHWYLGKLLLKTGQREEGWAEIRSSFKNNLGFLLAAIDLGWLETKGNVAEMEELLKLDSDRQKLVLGLFLLGKGAGLDAARFLCRTNSLTPDQRETLVQRLITLKNYKLALMTDSADCRIIENYPAYAGKVVNGSFEEDIRLGKKSFGWQINPGQKNFKIVTDNKRFDGSRSLRVNFTGTVSAGEPKLKQLIPVEAEKRYRLSFAARKRELVTDAFPLIFIKNVGEETGRVLAVSEVFKKNSDDWIETKMEFTTGTGDEAVEIILDLEKCKYRACPVFGTIWLDNFQLEKY